MDETTNEADLSLLQMPNLDLLPRGLVSSDLSDAQSCGYI